MTALETSTATWLRVGRPEDVPYLEGRSVRVGELRIAVFHLADGWAAVTHACPHAGGPLADGIVADGCVTCPLHGQRFSLRSGERQDAAGPGILTYAVRVRDGYLELCCET